MTAIPDRFRVFDGFRLDLDTRVLWYQGELLSLPPKAVSLLIELTEKPGKVISKDDLMDRVWGESFVEEGNLTNNIFLLRKVLKEAGGRQYISTVPKRGYRFVGELEEVEEIRTITIDRRYFSQTIIEDVSEENNIAAEANIEILPRSVLSKRIVAIGMGLAVFMVVGLGSWFGMRSSIGETKLSIRSIAVLPLRSQGGSDESIRMRLADAIATRLTETNALIVRSSALLASFDFEDRDHLAIGRQLDVDAVIDGHIQAEGSRLRVNLYLVDVDSGDYLWSGQFDGTADRLLALQDTIARRMLADLGIPFDRNKNNVAAVPSTENGEAYEQFLLGRLRFHKRGTENVNLAIEHFERAIELDPNFVGAKIGLANALAFNPLHRDRIHKLLTDLITADHSHSQIYAIRGFVRSFHDWNWTEGEVDFLTAIELDPHNSLARQWYASNLMVRSRFVEAETQLKRALDLDPTSVAILVDIGQLYFYQRHYENSEKYLLQANSLQGDNAGIKEFLRINRAASQRDERLARRDLTPSEDELAMVRDWDSIMDYLKKQNSEGYEGISEYKRLIAAKAAIAGDRETTLAKFRELAAMRNFMLPFQMMEPLFDLVRDDPEFTEIRRSMNL